MNGAESFRIAVVGASAGGLEAFRTLLAALPSDTKIAFLLVLHRDPRQEKFTVDLLAGYTAMAVSEAGEGTRLEADRVYVLPPGRYLTVADGVLHLLPSGEGGETRMPFDVLLESLTRAYGNRVACAVLTGEGSYRPLGALAVRRAGGLAMAQDPQEAAFDGMPRSAIAADAVSAVLTLRELAEALVEFGRRGTMPPAIAPPNGPSPPQRAADPGPDISEIAQQILSQAYAPPSVLVNFKKEAVHYFGPVDLYLRRPEGETRHAILPAVEEGLRSTLRTALDRATRSQERTVIRGAQLRRDGATYPVTVSVQPVRHDHETLLLVSFTDEAPSNAGRGSAEAEFQALKEEIKSLDETLQTSQEELKSRKEELKTLKVQLQQTIERAQAIADDLHNLLSSTDAAALFLDETLNIRFFTETVRPLFNLVSSDIGRPITALARSFDNGSLMADARSVLRDSTPIVRDVVAENGRAYLQRVLPYRTQADQVKGVVVTYAGVTENRAGERKREPLGPAGEGHDGEAISLGKSHLLAAASHNLRQPLQTLTLLLRALRDKVHDPEAIEPLTVMRETLDAMSATLDTLLGVSQLEAGVVTPEVSAFPIDGVLQHLRSQFAARAEAQGLRLRVVSSGHNVRSDPRLLEEILSNLLSNALKYTAKGKVLLGCRRRSGQLRIEVLDTGIGIADEHLQEIFQEFRQFGEPVHPHGWEGVGLGLAIAQLLVRLLGHRLDVRSRVEHGSAFAVTVPLAEDAPPPLELAEPPPPMITPPKDRLVLIVDDNPPLRRSLELLLHVEGYRTVSVPDGATALALARSGALQPDVAIVDFSLTGGMNGIQLMTDLRRLLGAALPAVILTGVVSSSLPREIERSGLVYCAKPISPDELLERVASLLSR